MSPRERQLVRSLLDAVAAHVRADKCRHECGWGALARAALEVAHECRFDDGDPPERADDLNDRGTPLVDDLVRDEMRRGPNKRQGGWANGQVNRAGPRWLDLGPFFSGRETEE